MNIFFLSANKKECVEMYVDKHVVKMILEYTQILCSVHHICGSVDESYVVPYKLTHKNHPCNVWTRESLSNYVYLVDLALELCKEYTYRYGKIHKSEQYIRKLGEIMPKIDDIGFTIPARAMPDEYKTKKDNITLEDVIESYRNYINGDKKHIFAWKKRQIPDFIII
jgi:hypothetical protein